MNRTWINNGDHLKLDGYDIRIRGIPESAMTAWHDARFYIEVDGLPTQRRITLKMAKECGEEAASETDELPIVLTQSPTEQERMT